MLNKISHRAVIALLTLLLCALANATCIDKDVKSFSAEIVARLTTVFERADYVIEIVQPQGISAACLVFRDRTNANESLATFELELPGQLGVHMVVLNQDYVVVESGTGNGSFLSEIFAMRKGKLARVKSIGSRTPPNFAKIGTQDYILTVNAFGKKMRTPL